MKDQFQASWPLYELPEKNLLPVLSKWQLTLVWLRKQAAKAYELSQL